MPNQSEVKLKVTEENFDKAYREYNIAFFEYILNRRYIGDNKEVHAWARRKLKELKYETD